MSDVDRLGQMRVVTPIRELLNCIKSIRRNVLRIISCI